MSGLLTLTPSQVEGVALLAEMVGAHNLRRLSQQMRAMIRPLSMSANEYAIIRQHYVWLTVDPR